MARAVAMTEAAPQQLVTQNQFAKLTGISQFQLCRLVRRGFLAPDFIASQVHLFRPTRARILKRAIRSLS
jgi:hypothetical protein